MKRLALALSLVAFTAMADDLVETARAAKVARKKSKTKVITNADVKKAKSPITTTSQPAPKVQQEPSLLEKHQATRAAEQITAERKAVLLQTVASLEKELALLELRYYDEDDLNRRDSEIVKRFQFTSSRLEAARKQLAEITPPVAAAPPPSPER